MAENHSSRAGLSLRKKLVLVVLLAALIPLLLATAVSYTIARHSLEEAALSKLVAIRDARAHHITDVYREIGSQAVSLARDQMLQDATLEFRQAFYKLPDELEWRGEKEGAAARKEAAVEELRDFYRVLFAEVFDDEADGASEIEALMPKDDAALAAQYLYIAANPREHGAKKLLDHPTGDTSAYGAHHRDYHPILREFAGEFGFYDLFLIDPKGVVVYSVEKEVDFGANLKTGALRDSGLADAFRLAVASDRVDEALLVDYAPYVPSLGEPASFAAAPLHVDGELAGVLVLQMPISRISSVMKGTEGLGETGETYLVGEDRLMRSESRFSKETSICASRVDTSAVRDALEGNVGEGVLEDYRGTEVFTAWRPLPVLGLNYALIADKDAEEALKPARKLFRWMAVLTAILVVAAVLVSRAVASSLARPMSEITRSLEGLAESMLSESQEQQAGAAEQSSAVEETTQTFQGLLDASSNMSRSGDEVLGHAEVSQRSAQTISSRIQELSGHTAQITEILALVKDIANKSEILALNAALEGTKAGEAGRGFSLVAQQMQRLAEQVMGSVKKIEGLTSDITQASGGAVLAAEEAEKVSRLTTDSARSIASAVGVQQSSAEQVSVAMNEIAQVAQRSVDAARHIVTSSNELLSVAERLRVTVGSKR